MPVYNNTSGNAPSPYSDLLQGEGHYIADRAIEQNQTLVAGEVIVKDASTGYWRANTFGVTDNPDTIDGVGVLMVAVTTGAGERPTMPVCQMGGVIASMLTGLPAGFGAGNHLGLLILE